MYGGAFGPVSNLSPYTYHSETRKDAPVSPSFNVFVVGFLAGALCVVFGVALWLYLMFNRVSESD